MAKLVELKFDEEVGSTAKAICLKFDEQLVWLPKSQLESLDLVNNVVELPRWLALEKGLEEYEV